MTKDVIDKIFIGQVRLFWTLVKWFMLQYVLLFLVPCIGGCALSVEVIACMATYTFLFKVGSLPDNARHLVIQLCIQLQILAMEADVLEKLVVKVIVFGVVLKGINLTVI